MEKTYINQELPVPICFHNFPECLILSYCYCHLIDSFENCYHVNAMCHYYLLTPNDMTLVSFSSGYARVSKSFVEADLQVDCSGLQYMITGDYYVCFLLSLYGFATVISCKYVHVISFDSHFLFPLESE